MIVPIFAAFGQMVFMFLLGTVALFLILLVLVQRGRGGGLAGALGGMGGSSAFGAKAGDVFTKITVIAATLWIVLCIAATKMTPQDESLINTGKTSTTAETSSLGAPPSTEEGESGEAEPTADTPAGEGPAGEGPAQPAAESTGAGSDEGSEEARDSKTP